MQIAEQLSLEISRRNTDYVADFVGDNKEKFDELMEIVFTGTQKLALRASWVVSTVTDKYPELFYPYLGSIVERLPNFSHSGIRRNLLRQVAQIEIPAELQGVLFDLCYNWLLSREEPPAVKAHCMQVLFNISEKEPDLKLELRLIFEELTEHDSAAIKSRSRQLLMKL